VRLLIESLRSSSTCALEVQNGLIALCLGLYLLLPFNTFASGAAYQMMAQLGTESGWGGAFLVLGFVQVVATLSDLVLARRICCALLTSLFSLYLLSIFLANPFSAGVPIAFPIIIGQTWSFIQSRRYR
jgi:hypothetical protein